ncbi:MAG: hypothetical protein OEM91_16055, partial [Hyphomicrobiales bacterium]|nr:hypothetical protein [Hyphomicrobiales bacterium]
MSQAMPDTENPVGMSHNLRATLQRAGGYASEQSHRFVTIEHILLALNEDPEAELMLQACTIDQGRLHADVSNYLGLLEDRLEPGEAAQPVLDAEAARIVNSAAIAAQKSRRSEVNGAIVLAAIIGDGRSPAANMLRTQGLTFKAAIEALQSAQSGASSPLPHEQTEQSDPAPPAPQAIEREPEQPAPEMPQAASEQTGRPRPTVTEDA